MNEERGIWGADKRMGSLRAAGEVGSVSRGFVLRW